MGLNGQFISGWQLQTNQGTKVLIGFGKDVDAVANGWLVDIY